MIIFHLISSLFILFIEDKNTDCCFCYFQENENENWYSNLVDSISLGGGRTTPSMLRRGGDNYSDTLSVSNTPCVLKVVCVYVGRVRLKEYVVRF